MMEYVLQTKNLKKKYRDFEALRGLDMHVPQGSIYGFVGLCIGQAFLSRLTDVDLYLQGRERMLELVLFLSDFLPGSQLMEFRALKYSVGNLNPIVIVSGSVVFTVLLTVIGLIRFRRKELQ